MKNRKIHITILAAGIALGLLATPAAAGMTIEAGVEETVSAAQGLEEYGNIQQAAADLRDEMLDRQKNITIKIKTENTSVEEELSSLLKIVYAEDLLNPTAGDYLRQSVLQMDISYQILQTQGDSALYVTFTFTCTYSTNFQQETYVTSQVKKIISKLNLTGKADDEKIKAVYDYVTKKVDYDYEGINTKLSHSAYAAIANGKAVCQGYSLLAYRLLRECGIQSRIITGKSQNQNHAWNIVPVNDLWYNIDATWDSNFDGNDQKYMYFLKGNSEFADHVRNAEFLTVEFLKKYPMSSSSYARYQPAVVKVTGVKSAKVTSSYVTLTWNKQAKAECYYVCHLVNGKFKTSSKWKTTKNSFKITTDFNGKKLIAGKSYTYGVIAYNKKTGNTVVSAPVTVTLKKETAPAKTSFSKLNASSSKITAAWKKVSSCNGYQLQYSTNEKFTSKATSTIKLTGQNTLKTTIKSLKKGKTYYIRVRAWKKVDGKNLYGSWSTVKGLKCK